MISFGEKYFSDDGEYVTEIICITNSLEESTATTTSVDYSNNHNDIIITPTGASTTTTTTDTATFFHQLLAILLSELSLLVITLDNKSTSPSV